jgi:hypothetical protein
VYVGFSKQSKLSKLNIIIELNTEKNPPSDNAIQQWLLAVSRDWQCSAPNRTRKAKHFSGRCSSNQARIFLKPIKINYMSFFSVRYITTERWEQHSPPCLWSALTLDDKPHLSNLTRTFYKTVKLRSILAKEPRFTYQGC